MAGPPIDQEQLEQIQKHALIHAFLDYGVQYYIVARFAFLSNYHPIAGHIFHHSIEYILKSYLLSHVALADLKDKYGHNLEELWGEFKRMYNLALDSYDSLIKELHKWEELRYPGRDKGNITMLFDTHTSGKSSHHLIKPQPKQEELFTVCLEDIDKLFKDLISIDPANGDKFLHHIRMPIAAEALEKQNKHPFIIRAIGDIVD